MFRLLAALLVPAVVVLAGLVLLPAPDGDARPVDSIAARHAEEADLGVTLDSMTPAVLPARRPLVLRGRVTNRTDETWSDLNVSLCTSDTPITTESELQAAVESDPLMVVCRRQGAFVGIGDLAPGQTRRYTLRATRDELGIPEGVEGVFWLNVHVLGTSAEGRDGISDGRARTFISSVDRRRDPVPTSVVLPLRADVERDSDGRLVDTERWVEDLSRGGRLDNVVRLAGRGDAAGAPLLVDPAVVGAVHQLGRGNPPRSLTPAEETEREAGDPAARTARAWLDRFLATARARGVLALPYGDIDVAAVGAHDPSVYAAARHQSQSALDALDIRSTPAIVPPAGRLSREGLALADDETVVLLSEEALPEAWADDDTPPAVVEWQEHRIGIYDDGVALGGPAPEPRLAALAVRQRVLAEATLRAINADDRPLLVNLPPGTDPGPRGGEFFSGLDQRFVDLRADPVGARAEDRPDLPEIEEPAYPEEAAEAELEEGNVDRVDEVVGAATVLGDVLAEDDQIGTALTREGLSWLSYFRREDPFAAATAADRLASWIHARLRSVSIEAPPFVILSADSGPFPVTVTNDLPQAAQLQIQAQTDDGVVIRAPETITLPAGASQTFNLQAQANSIGVHNVTLVATDTQGRPLGASEDLNVRSNQVGKVIWVVLGAGVGILFLAIAIRLVRRVKGRGTA